MPAYFGYTTPIRSLSGGKQFSDAAKIESVISLPNDKTAKAKAKQFGVGLVRVNSPVFSFGNHGPISDRAAMMAEENYVNHWYFPGQTGDERLVKVVLRNKADNPDHIVGSADLSQQSQITVGHIAYMAFLMGEAERNDVPNVQAMRVMDYTVESVRYTKTRTNVVLRVNHLGARTNA